MIHTYGHFFTGLLIPLFKIGCGSSREKCDFNGASKIVGTFIFVNLFLLRPAQDCDCWIHCGYALIYRSGMSWIGRPDEIKSILLNYNRIVWTRTCPFDIINVLSYPVRLFACVRLYMYLWNCCVTRLSYPLRTEYWTRS